MISMSSDVIIIISITDIINYRSTVFCYALKLYIKLIFLMLYIHNFFYYYVPEFFDFFFLSHHFHVVFNMEMGQAYYSHYFSSIFLYRLWGPGPRGFGTPSPALINSLNFSVSRHVIFISNSNRCVKWGTRNSI